MSKRREKAYWQKRFEQLEDASHNKAIDYEENLRKQYIECSQEIEKQIRAWYQRFADNNSMTMSEAKKLLKGDELKELKWNIEEYIQYGQENALDQSWMKELENASARFHISRLEGLQMNTKQAIEKLYGRQSDDITSLLADIYTDNSYRAMFEMQRGWNTGFDVSGLDERDLDKILSRPWAVDGTNFSDRIWNNKEKLIGELETELTKMCALGTGPDEAIRNIAHRLDVSYGRARTLVQTETAYFQTLSDYDMFRELGCEEYEITATLDSHTSDICQAMDGQVFRMSDFAVGATAPPFHPNCRSVMVPYFDDEFTEDEVRAARNADDEATYYVPADTTYSEWQEAFIEGDHADFIETSRNGRTSYSKGDRIELKAEDLDGLFTAKKAEMKNTQKFVDYVNGLDSPNQTVLELYSHLGELQEKIPNSVDFRISHKKGDALEITYRIGDRGLTKMTLVVPKFDDAYDLIGQMDTFLHENMHFIDFMSRNGNMGIYSDYFSSTQSNLLNAFSKKDTSMSDDIAKLFSDHKAEMKSIYDDELSKLRKSEEDLLKKYDAKSALQVPRSELKSYRREYNKLQREFEKTVDSRRRSALGGGVNALEDIYDALSEGDLYSQGYYGHGASYYREPGAKVEETVANYASLSVTRPDLVDMLREDKPELVKELDKYMEKLSKKMKKAK